MDDNPIVIPHGGEVSCVGGIIIPGLVKRTERGWGAHFICAAECLFRRNTLLRFNGVSIVISTVGNWQPRDEAVKVIGSSGQYFETMAFHSDPTDTRYHDADVHQPIAFDSPWIMKEQDADDRANLMHEAVVEEITLELQRGNAYPKKLAGE